jgi:hypothetical protein
VKAAALVKKAGHEFVGPVKTSHKNFPKTQLEELMNDWPGGMSFVLEGVTPPSAPGEVGLQLLAIGHKCNSRKVLSFVCTKDAGPTSNGIAYTKRSGPTSTETCELGRSSARKSFRATSSIPMLSIATIMLDKLFLDLRRSGQPRTVGSG